jgi:lantibiotic modifying enzyme
MLIARHAAAGDWPSGTPSGGPNPSLMLGTAGIGYTVLRLHDPNRVPSILWVGC